MRRLAYIAALFLAASVAVGQPFDMPIEPGGDDPDMELTNPTWTLPSTVTVAADAATINWSNGSVQIFDLQGSTAAVTLTLTNPVTAGSYYIKVIQGDNGDTITWPGTVDWPAGTAPTITAADDSVDIVACLYDGSSYLCTFSQDIQ